MAERKNWTREETILAFDLYCKVPFSKISKTNEKIIDLAKVIGRTPSAVGLKMANLARFDKELQSRDVSAITGKNFHTRHKLYLPIENKRQLKRCLIMLM